MNTPTSTQEHISRLIGFRQAAYTDIFQQRRDALFEMLDALLCGGTLPSFAYLSQHERFRRKWHSLYVAVEDGQIDTCALRRLLVQQLPQEGVCVFPLDSSCWSRPRSRVLEDLQYVYQASSAVNGGTVSIGYPYPLLEWCAEPHTSWSLPLDVRRMDNQHTAQDVGAEQVRALAQAREGCSQALDIVVADGKYGNVGFLSRVSGLRVGIVACLRSDRVFYRPAEPTSGRRGRPPKYGERFDCQENWGEPDEVLEFVDEQYGKVCLKRWKGLRDKRAPDLTVDLVRAQRRIWKRTDRLPRCGWCGCPPAPACAPRHHCPDHLDGLQQPLDGGSGHSFPQRGFGLDFTSLPVCTDR